MIGFVLLNVLPDKENDVMLALKKEKGVVDINSLFGEYNFIVKISTSTYKEVGELVSKIKLMEGVINTKTLVGTLM